jgi:hypothetical protein
LAAAFAFHARHRRVRLDAGSSAAIARLSRFEQVHCGPELSGRNHVGLSQRAANTFLGRARGPHPTLTGRAVKKRSSKFAVTAALLARYWCLSAQPAAIVRRSDLADCMF